MADICSNHLSLYQLTVEPGTALSKAVKRGDVVSFFLSCNILYYVAISNIMQVLPDSDSMADMYEATVSVRLVYSYYNRSLE